MIYYEDKDIKIRDICEEDVVSLFSWRIDKELNKHDPRPLPRNSKELIDECMNYCKIFDKEIMNENIEERKYKFFIITGSENEPIGFINFFSIDKVKKQGELGVKIGDKRYQNKGIAYKAASFILDYIFNNMDIKRIYIETGENNISALSLFKKLNFEKCGEYMEDDNFKFIVMEKMSG